VLLIYHLYRSLPPASKRSLFLCFRYVRQIIRILG